VSNDGRRIRRLCGQDAKRARLQIGDMQHPDRALPGVKRQPDVPVGQRKGAATTWTRAVAPVEHRQ
jgi:hypothetical protein